jgi:hypothetical protein
VARSGQEPYTLVLNWLAGLKKLYGEDDRTNLAIAADIAGRTLGAGRQVSRGLPVPDTPTAVSGVSREESGQCPVGRLRTGVASFRHCHFLGAWHEMTSKTAFAAFRYNDNYD